MAALSDTEKDVERIQIGLFRAASIPAKVSLLRSLTRTTILLSRRAIRESAVDLPEPLRFVGFTYGFELSNAIQRHLQDEYYIDDTSIRRAISNHSSFNLIHLGTMLKVDIFIPVSEIWMTFSIAP